MNMQKMQMHFAERKKEERNKYIMLYLKNLRLDDLSLNLI